MSSEITKDDLNELKSEITALKELYEKELERERIERDLQATEDSKQLEISTAEKLAEDEQETADRQTQQEFQTLIENFLLEYHEIELENNQTISTGALEALQGTQERHIQDLLDSIKSNGEALETLTLEIQSGSKQLDRQHQQTGYTVGLVGTVVVAILVFVFLDWFFKPFFSF
ncbi:hypothetical protein IW492_17455 [Enterococcus sp. BWB1-3]|uniref:hypothetical protein n=1 Tax=Enterococcus sp. BWB1-3 TaxID=2787713 RepID=UPI0019224F18|nr:hypothetical protein [Enterococcus sp. BWB1-3]MBL1231014.1 hypothetical protein [Enterococcus sp. BWB1-3]